MNERLAAAKVAWAEKFNTEPFTPTEDEQAWIETAAKVMADLVSARLNELSRNPYGRALAAKTVDKHRSWGSSLYAKHWPPKVDPKDPATMNRLYAILDRLPRKLYPLSERYGWKTLAAERLSAYTACDPRISPSCQTYGARETFAIKRGEFVCVYKSCTPCQDWFDCDEPPARDDLDQYLEENQLGQPDLKLVALTQDQIHDAKPAITDWLSEGNDAFAADVAKRVPAGEDPTSARKFVKAEAEWHVAKMLDDMRENDPERFAALTDTIRRMFAEFGKPVSYPFN